MEFSDLEEIYELIQRGGGKTSVKTTTRIPRLIESFQKSGWNRSFLRTHFKQLDDSMVQDWTDQRFIEEYMKFLARKIAIETHSHSIIDILKAHGLHSRLATQADIACRPLIGSSYSFLQVLDCAIEYVLKKWKPMTAVTVPYFLEPNQQDKWIPYEGKQIWNLSFPCNESFPTIQRYINEHFPSPTYYYHTTTWIYIKRIFQRVSHNVGRRCLDFGYTSGFYMSETLRDCVEWGKKNTKKWNNEVAILIFQLPSLGYLQSNFNVKILEGEHWKHIVSASRDCEDDDDIVHDLDVNYDFVYGPMLANVDTYNVEGPQKHTKEKMQLTSKSDKADKFLTKNLVGALVFRK